MYFYLPEGAAIAAIAITLLLAIVLAVLFGPSKKREKLSGFGAWLNDLFNFRSLIIEKILKFLYILSTCFCIVGGLIGAICAIADGADITVILGLLAVVVLGPIAVRFVYEFLMMAILLVTNVLEINRKLRWPEAKAPEQRPAPEQKLTPEQPPVPKSVAFQAPAQPAVEPVFGYCTQCGTKYDLNQGNCPNCGKK